MKRRSGTVAALPFLLALSLGACSSASDSATDKASDTATKSVAAQDATTEAAAPSADTIAADADFNAADVTFAQGMIPHHQQAVEMATIALDPARKAGSAVKDLATRIQGAQGPEIELMNGWLKEWGQPVDGMAGMDHSNMDHSDMNHSDMGAMAGMEGMMSAKEMTALAAARGAELDKSWLDMMVRHHEGAVTMSKTLQSGGRNAAAKELAGKIISAQEGEIAEMRALLG